MHFPLVACWFYCSKYNIGLRLHNLCQLCRTTQGLLFCMQRYFFFKQAIKIAINAKQEYRQTAGQGINLGASHLKNKSDKYMVSIHLLVT